ncbi:MAG: CaiB/BaiF CoA-transferase family protein [Actinomycetes bacterium]
MSTPALGGVTVLDFATVGPAARASRMLSDYGATVIKIGAVAKSGAVQIEPPFYAYSGQRDMKKIRLDLKTPVGKATFLRLATSADVVLESFRPGVVDRLGIGFNDVSAVNPKIIYCSTSGYGQNGPASQWAGHDINYLGMGGYLDCSERAVGDKPPLPGATVADAAAGGMQAAMAIMAALVRRSNTGEGSFLDVSIADGVLSLMSLYIDEYLATGTVPGPGHYILTGRYACYDTYRCGDGKWVTVGAIEPAFFANLCRLLNCDEWANHQLDDAVQDEIRASFRTTFLRQTRDEWVHELASQNTCVGPVYSVPELVDDAHVAARGLIGIAIHETEGPFRQLGTVLAGTDTARHEFQVRSSANTDTDEVLEAAGLSTDEIIQMRNEGIVA